MAKSRGQKRRREAEADQERKAAGEDAEGTHPSKKSRVEEKRSLFVRSIPATATSESLTEYFSQHYPVKHAMVVIDPNTKKSRGYGFVTFTDTDDAIQAKDKLNNELWEGRRLKLDIAEPRHRTSSAASKSELSTKLVEEKRKREEELAESKKPPKLIVRNLPWSVKTSDQLARLFQSYGKVKFADLPQEKGKLSGFGFVTLRGRKNAEKAMEGVNGKEIDGRTIAVDWAVSKDVWEQQKENGEEDGDHEDGGKPKKEHKSKTKKPDPEKEVDEADADLENFMRNHMENLEDEEDDSDDENKEEDDSDKEDIAEEEEDNEDEGREEEKEQKPKPTTDNSTTLFLRNLPFSTTDEQLKQHFTKFGPVRYARVVMDRATDRPAGTGFVCFVNDEDFRNCLKGAPRHKPPSTSARHSILQDETVDHDGRYTIEGRVLQVAQAVSKVEATRLTEEGPAARKGQDRDKRRLYLLSEGTIPQSSPLYSLLAPAEVKLRDTSAQQRKKMVETNPSLHLSLTRLAVRNIPHNMTSKDLKALAREAVVGFAKDAKEGRRQPLSKEEIARAGQEDKDAEHRRKEKKKGVVRQSKIVFESKEGSKVNEETGAGRSRGYGFIEYSSHRWALMGLRWLNGHAVKNDAGKTFRLVVEFAIENAQVVMRRRAAEEKARTQERTRDTESGGIKRGSYNGQRGNDWKGKDFKSSRPKGQKPSSKQADQGDDKGEPATTKDAASKLAMRQQIIGRKRMMRKKKAGARRGA